MSCDSFRAGLGQDCGVGALKGKSGCCRVGSAFASGSESAQIPRCPISGRRLGVEEGKNPGAFSGLRWRQRGQFPHLLEAQGTFPLNHPLCLAQKRSEQKFAPTRCWWAVGWVTMCFRSFCAWLQIFCTVNFGCLGLVKIRWVWLPCACFPSISHSCCSGTAGMVASLAIT